jgi:hypothetical protein
LPFRAILVAMMARQLAGAMIALVLGAACGKQLNPAYCDDHPDDQDCRNSGMVAIDAPPGECRSSADCATSTSGKVCDTASQTCVQCIVGVDVTGCSGATPQCGDDNQCHGCILDAHCSASNVCLPSGMCGDETAILYASPNGNGNNCTQAAPCKFAAAIAAIASTKHVIKLTVTNGTVYREPPITIDTAIGVLIIGPSATFEPNASGDAVTINGGNIEIVGLTVANAMGGDGIVCNNNATLTLRRMTIRGNPEYGVLSQGCTVNIDRTRLSANRLGALDLNAGKLEIRNNIIDKNGNGELENGNVSLANVSGRLVFNTIVENDSKNGGQRVGGVDCSPAGGEIMLVSRNIISDNGGAAALGGNCTTGNTNFTGDIANIRFVNLTDYRLSAMTPTTILRDDPDSTADCMPAGKYIDDIDGQLRPAGFCDRGADEYKP